METDQQNVMDEIIETMELIGMSVKIRCRSLRNMTLAEKLIAVISEAHVTPEGCLESPRAPSHSGLGYPQLQHHGSSIPITRLIMRYAGYNIDGMDVCHTCDNPKCIYTAHLFVGTRQDNMIDSAIKCRRHGQKIPRSDSLGSFSIQRLRELEFNNMSQININTDRLLQPKDIAKAMGVSHGAVLGWIKAGVIPYIPLPRGRGYRIRQEVLDKLLQEQERKP